MIKLGLSPSGTLHLIMDADIGQSDAWTKKLIAAFTCTHCEGLFFLAAGKHTELLDPTLSYWREFASHYMTRLCQVPETANSKIEPIELPTEAELAELLLIVPPMQGAEYLSLEVLKTLWEQLDQHIRSLIAQSSGIGNFIQKKASHWHRVGRVCFHLAENKKNHDLPFAFMATYSSGISSGGKLKHIPLSKALNEYSGAKNKNALIKLLSPINLASKSSKTASELIESGDIFHPLAWTPSQAYCFLQDVELFEQSGVMVRLPNWWKQRPKPQVSVTIGNSGSAKFGVEHMLNFKIELALDGEQLTHEEYEQLMQAENGLVLLRGQWVEVDTEKLSQALKHWEKVDKHARNGEISFIEGMRLLAGTPSNLSGKVSLEQQEWSFVQAGEWLGEILQQLRNPVQIAQSKPGKSLKAELRHYQETGLNWLWFMTNLGLGACLADDMGLGKTVQMLALLLCLKKAGSKRNKKPSLLVLPASLVANWKSEAERFAPDLKLKFIHPSQTTKQDIEKTANDPDKQLAGFDLVITTYAMVLRQKWLENVNWRIVILDEAQAIKNPASGQTKAIKNLSTDSRIALTGTPIENRLGDLWSLMDFLNPGLLGSVSTFKRFIKQLESNQQAGYAPLRKLVSPYILRRMKTDKSIISDLPDKTEVNAYCGLSKQQLALYSNSVKQLSLDLENSDGIQRKGLVLAYLMRFKQICNHPSQLLGDGIYNPKHSGKFARLGKICEEIASRQEKVLIFTQFRAMTEPLAKFLGDIFEHNGLILHGQTSIKKRKNLIDDFQREDGPSFFVLSLKAGGTGLNLTAASHVIHFDRWWNPAVENQATDRAFRIGQTKNVLVNKFVTQGTIEEKINELIYEKTKLADDILHGGVEKNLTEMNDDELIKLVSLDVNKAGI